MPHKRVMLVVDVNILRKQYPAGTRLRLLRGIDDPFSPKRQGDVVTVSFVDDAGQIHGRWDSGGSLALIAGKDDFEKVGHRQGGVSC